MYCFLCARLATAFFARLARAPFLYLCSYGLGIIGGISVDIGCNLDRLKGTWNGLHGCVSKPHTSCIPILTILLIFTLPSSHSAADAHLCTKRSVSVKNLHFPCLKSLSMIFTNNKAMMETIEGPVLYVVVLNVVLIGVCQVLFLYCLFLSVLRLVLS